MKKKKDFEKKFWALKAIRVGNVVPQCADPE
jgi:hypothetical protein